MKNIELSKKEYNQLDKQENIVANGIEGHVLKYYDDELVYLKIFNSFLMPSDLEKRLMYLCKLKNIKIITLPLKTVTVNHELVGYSMEPYYDSLFNQRFMFDQKLRLLFKVKSALDILHENGIIYGDIKADNILSDGTDIRFCDMCNVKMGEMDFNVKTPFITNYQNKTKKIDHKLDNYVMNLFSLSYLRGIKSIQNEKDIKKMLDKNNIPLYYDKIEFLKILKEILNLDKNYSGEYLIDVIKDKYK